MERDLVSILWWLTSEIAESLQHHNVQKLPEGIIMEGNAYKVKAKATCKGAVIFMHGLGDSGEGWSQVSFALELDCLILVV